MQMHKGPTPSALALRESIRGESPPKHGVLQSEATALVRRDNLREAINIKRTTSTTPQAKKRIRRNNRRAEVNGARVGRIRTFVKKVEAALAGGDKAAAAEALKAAQPELARGVARGVLHKNTASRKLSRLTKRVSAL